MKLLDANEILSFIQIFHSYFHKMVDIVYQDNVLISRDCVKLVYDTQALNIRGDDGMLFCHFFHIF